MNTGTETGMDTQPMDERRFAALADSYGAAIARWPATEQAAARALLRRSPSLQARLAAADELDRRLAELPPPAAPAPALRRRILADVPERPAGVVALLSALWTDLGGIRRAGPMLACGLALGVVLAPLAAPPEAIDQEEQMLHIVLTDAEHEDWLL
jgi:hypothetical protein